MRMPHGTVEGSAQRPQHSRAVGSVVPGGFTHVVVALHAVPTPVHERHVWPAASTWLGMVMPHG